MNKPIVSCQILGQLGNQLFILATTLSYSWDYDAIALFPELHNPEYRISYNREKLFFRLDSSPLPRPCKKEFWQKYWFDAERIPYCEEDLFLYGYFQSWKHFHHHRERLLSVFAPKQETLDYLHKKYGSLIDHPNTVSVHVRTNSKKVHQFIPFLGLDYTRDAMALFPDDVKFVIFSDRINWCKQQLSQFDRDCTFIEGNDSVEDLILMSMMKHNIIANSTFSWWGTYLNQHADKRVVAPSIVTPGAPSVNLYFPEWIIVPVTLGPYPSDMYAYDATSQSLDNND